MSPSESQHERPADDLPGRPCSLSSMAKLLLDRAAVCGVRTLSPDYSWSDADGIKTRVRDETLRLIAFQNDQGWDEQPALLHEAPEPLHRVRLEATSTWGRSIEHLSFESGYEPKLGDPTKDRWDSYEHNRTAHAWVLRDPGTRGRPWVVCIHAYLMGSPAVDLRAFRAWKLRDRYGVNVLSYVMPLHGPRRGSASAFEPFLHGVGNLVHTTAQAVWDLRRIVSWLRREGAEWVGVQGLSLGGYTSALLACFEPTLAFVMPGIPAVDFCDLIRRNAGPVVDADEEFWALAQRALKPVSPLEIPVGVAKESRFIFAGLVDQMTRPESVRRLWLHWEKPRIEWYPGSHLSFYFEPSVERLVDGVLSETSARYAAARASRGLP